MFEKRKIKNKKKRNKEILIHIKVDSKYLLKFNTIITKSQKTYLLNLVNHLII